MNLRTAIEREEECGWPGCHRLPRAKVDVRTLDGRRFDGFFCREHVESLQRRAGMRNN